MLQVAVAVVLLEKRVTRKNNYNIVVKIFSWVKINHENYLHENILQ